MCNNIISLYDKDNFYDLKKVNPILKKYIFPTSNKYALEIGCGIGINALYIKNMGYDVIAVDINQKAISSACKKGINVINIDIRDFPWEQDFDLVTSFYMFQHLSKQDAINVLNKIETYTTPNSMVILAIFIDRQNTVNNEDIAQIFSNKFILIKENFWNRLDTEHGKPHRHKGYYCIYKKKAENGTNKY